MNKHNIGNGTPWIMHSEAIKAQFAFFKDVLKLYGNYHKDYEKIAKTNPS